MDAANLLAALGVLVGIIGVVVGIAYAKASGRPVFRQVGNSVVSASLEDHISVQYDSKDVPRVTRTRLVFWNAGIKKLSGSDVVDEYPIDFSFTDNQVRILSVETLRASDEANKLEATVDDNGTGVSVSYKYLEPRQGALIEVLHTSEEWRAKASDKIEGVPRGVREVRFYNTVREQPLFSLLLMMAGYLSIVPPIGASAIIIAAGGPLWLVVIVDLLYVLAVCWLVRVGWRRTREPRILSLSSGRDHEKVSDTSLTTI